MTLKEKFAIIVMAAMSTTAFALTFAVQPPPEGEQAKEKQANVKKAKVKQTKAKNAKAKDAEPAAGEALFTSLSYEGDDDYYRNNPLPDRHSFYNPVIPGWASDPSMCKVGDDYYLVTSTFTYFPGIPLYHSKDMVNWRLAGNVLSRPSQLQHLSGQRMNDGGIYAPAISYNPQNKTFYVITTDVGWANFYVTAKDPLGEWSDPIELPDVKGIDPSFFFDDDGKAYIVHKEDTKGQPKWNINRALRIIRFDVATGKTFGEDMPMKEEGVGPDEHLDRDEGPHIYKIGGTYYLTAAEGGTGDKHSEVVYKATNILGPWTRRSRNPMLTQRNLKERRTNPTTCTGHTDMAQDGNGQWWAVFLGCRSYAPGISPLGRETFTMPVRWSGDNYPYLTQCTDTVPYIITRPDVVREEGIENGNFSWTEDFLAKELSAKYLSVWGDPSPYYTLKGGMHLKCAPVKVKDMKPMAYVGRRLQHHRFTLQTSLRFNPAEGEKAGLLILRNEQHHFFLAVAKGRVELLQVGKQEKVVASAAIDIDAATDYQLKAVNSGKTLAFYYNVGSGWQLLADGLDSAFLSNGGGFIGSTAGIYATKE